jgi:hypothetical protein
MGDVGIFYDHWILLSHLVYFMVISYIFPILVCCTKNKLATLELIRKAQVSSQRMNFPRLIRTLSEVYQCHKNKKSEKVHSIFIFNMRQLLPTFICSYHF